MHVLMAERQLMRSGREQTVGLFLARRPAVPCGRRTEPGACNGMKAVAAAALRHIWVPDTE